MPIGGRTRVAAVLGWPVQHTRSPALHNAAYAAAGLDAVYVALGVLPERLGPALAGVRALSMMGVNLTVPHKEAALALCDELEPRARRTGAVNTVVVSDGRLVGHNTDIDGFTDSLDEEAPGAITGGSPAVVLGSGGAARAVVVGLAERGMDVTVVARTPGRAEALRPLGARDILPWETPALAPIFERATLLVDATSAALHEADETAVPAPLPVDTLPAGAVIASLVYHRLPDLVARARSRGLHAIDGKGMLLHQAARAFTLMTGQPAPVDAMLAAWV